MTPLIEFAQQNPAAVAPDVQLHVISLSDLNKTALARLARACQ